MENKRMPKTDDHTERKWKINATFAHFMKKSMHLKTGFLSDYQVVFLLLNGPHIEESL